MADKLTVNLRGDGSKANIFCKSKYFLQTIPPPPIPTPHPYLIGPAKLQNDQFKKCIYIHTKYWSPELLDSFMQNIFSFCFCSVWVVGNKYI